jgi:hypothetical protein
VRTHGKDQILTTNLNGVEEVRSNNGATDQIIDELRTNNHQLKTNNDQLQKEMADLRTFTKDLMGELASIKTQLSEVTKQLASVTKTASSLTQLATVVRFPLLSDDPLETLTAVMDLRQEPPQAVCHLSTDTTLNVLIALGLGHRCRISTKRFPPR